MDRDTCCILLKTDIDWLTSAATRLEQRLRFSAAKYLGGCISLATAIFGFGNLLARNAETDLPTLYESNKIYLGIIGIFLHLLGVVQLLSYARDRKHYIKIVNGINDL
jgi:hypothetical protein